MTTTVTTAEEWRARRGDLVNAGGARPTVGFVPTMGALHQGHVSLVERSRRENDFTLVSIFVNPTQFDQAGDLARYPRTLPEDLGMLQAAGADFLFHPEAAALYPDQYRYRIQESELSRGLCGAHRPGHFDGVLTIVLKLLMIAGADRAYFGEKDYQQLELIRGMAQAFFLPTEIVACPTVRERDGLAMSSRNRLLTAGDRELAGRFPGALLSAAAPTDARRELERLGFEVDYVEDRGARRFGAVRLGKVRLIDNVALRANDNVAPRANDSVALRATADAATQAARS